MVIVGDVLDVVSYLRFKCALGGRRCGRSVWSHWLGQPRPALTQGDSPTSASACMPDRIRVGAVPLMSCCVMVRLPPGRTPPGRQPPVTERDRNDARCVWWLAQNTNPTRGLCPLSWSHLRGAGRPVQCAPPKIRELCCDTLT